MSAAAEPVVPDGEATEPGRKGRKKLIALVAAAVLLAGGGAAWVIKKKRAAAEAAGEGDADAPAAARAPHRELHKTPPAFLPLENFVVNLPTAKPSATRRSASPWSWTTPGSRTSSRPTCRPSATASSWCSRTRPRRSCSPARARKSSPPR